MTRTGSPGDCVLVVDDETRILELVSRALEGRNVVTASTAEEARLHAADASLILLDLKLGEHDGMNLLAEFRRNSPLTPVIIMTAFASIENAVEAMRRGAYDYITKPFASLDDLRLTVDRGLGEIKLRNENRRLRELLVEQDRFEDMIGGSEPMRRLYDAVARIAETDSTVLITGESGTGKELVARAIHRRSARSRRPFLEINCAAIPATLLESELFGYEKGAFTGAVRMKKGLLESAPGGTVFLDEIGEMTTDLQVKLLKVLDENSFIKLGASVVTRVDVRILAATNRNLHEAVARGTFRDDLYFRLAVLPVEVPPLRERPGDVMKLFAALAPDIAFDADAMNILESYAWPGNIRELKNIVERTKSMRLPKVTAADMSSLLSIKKTSAPGKVSRSLPDLVDAYERDLIVSALKDAQGSRNDAANLLDVSRQALQYKIEKHKIDY